MQSPASNKGRRSLKFKLALALLLFEPCRLSYGQILGQNPTIGGTPAQCAGVVTALDRNLDHIAGSGPKQIKLRPDFFQQPRLKQLFIYAHECGHHIHGESESAADCYAVKTGRTEGWLTLQRLAEITNSKYWNKRDWPHAPGHIRGQQMLACYHAL
jgi:hypothetical protein